MKYQSKLKSRCRGCKKEFKFMGEAYFICSKECRKEWKKRLTHSKLGMASLKEMNKISKEESK